MVSCKIKGCKNRSDHTATRRIHFYSYPKDASIFSKWLDVSKDSDSYKHARVCSDHFKPSDYKPKEDYESEYKGSNRNGVRTLLPYAVPTLNIGIEDPLKTSKKPKCKRSLNITVDRTLNNDISSTVYLQLVDNSSSEISFTPLKKVKIDDNQLNLDSEFEHIEAPAHVLDHQYTFYEDLKSNNYMHNYIENENAFNKNQIDQYMIPQSKTSDQETISQLKKQLQVAMMEKENLQKRIKRLQSNTRIVVANKVHALLSTVFSAKQIDKLLDPYKTKIKWTIDDIISAITLHNISSKAYCYLREKNYPLPGLSTIRKWATCINISEGVLADVLTIMKCKARTMSVFQKITVLNFNETRIADKYYQICIARGLFYKWVQPIYYSSEYFLSSNVIKEIMTTLYDMGYIVVAMNCNIESFDDQLWVDLNVGVNDPQECFFEHPSNKDFKIFVFPNDFHLLVLIRAHFLYNGFIVKDKYVNKQYLEDIINFKRGMEKKECNVIKSEFLIDYDCNKENALLARQLFSKRTAEEISRYGREEMLAFKDWEDYAYFFESLSEWINLFDSKVKEGCEEGQEPYGLHLNHQNNILSNTESLMKWTKVQGFETSSPFQEQVVLSCLSLQQLFLYLQEHFSIEDFRIKYLLTNRLSAEFSECFIEYLSGEDLQYDMSIAKFRYRLRKLILGKYSADSVFNKFLKNSEPCLIDFNERSDTSGDVNEAQRQKAYVAETAEKMRKFLSDNDISTNKVHENLLQIINKAS